MNIPNKDINLKKSSDKDLRRFLISAKEKQSTFDFLFSKHGNSVDSVVAYNLERGFELWKEFRNEIETEMKRRGIL